MRLDGKFALVTGASSGIGEAAARALAGRGARVALVARSADKLARVAGEIAAAGGKALVFPADLADPDQAARACDAAMAAAGAPDILVNNAGAGRWLSTMETSLAEARAMIELPYLAAFAVTKAFLPAMLARGSGHIVNVTSPASYIAWPNAAAYIAARQALKGFSDALRLEVAPRGLLVSLVVLGTVESSYWEHNPGSRERVPKGIAPLTTDQAAQAIVRAIEKRKRYVVRPALFRLLFAMEAIAPGITARR
ncbi:MAG: SDR family NAD(P)-dependent oxidoreductase [Roseiarcus sp.]|jgi:short-subunit dehydrogenase